MTDAGGTRPMAPDARIYVAGHRGLVGSALMRALARRGYSNLIVRTHAELDLTDEGRVRAFFEAERPQFVFLAAAKVGGILANRDLPGEFIRDNLAIQTNVLHAAWACGVRRLVFFGSSCIYPRDCPQPIREEYLLTGPLEATNRAYAAAKIAGIEMCRAYNRQYGTRFLAVMPANLYGPGDNYDSSTSHVLPALIRKMHEANSVSAGEIVLWGTGKPRREFLYSDDLAEGAVTLSSLDDRLFDALIGNGDEAPLINIGCGEDMTIAELAALVARVVGYAGRIRWDATKPDGTPRKLLDVRRMLDLGWKPAVSLAEGVARAYGEYLQRCGSARDA